MFCSVCDGFLNLLAGRVWIIFEKFLFVWSSPIAVFKVLKLGSLDWGFIKGGSRQFSRGKKFSAPLPDFYTSNHSVCLKHTSVCVCPSPSDIGNRITDMINWSNCFHISIPTVFNYHGCNSGSSIMHNYTTGMDCTAGLWYWSHFKFASEGSTVSETHWDDGRTRRQRGRFRESRI